MSETKCFALQTRLQGLILTEHWIRPRIPVLSIRLAVLTVSPLWHDGLNEASKARLDRPPQAE